MAWSTRETQARRSIGMGISHTFDRVMDMTHNAYSAGLGPYDTWCVDPAITASGDGKTWEGAWKTMTEAIDACSDGDTVLLAGTLTEHIDYSSYAAGPNRIRILGAGEGIEAAVWLQVLLGTSTSHMIDLQCHGWTFDNIQFRGPKAYSIIKLDMPTSAGGARCTTIKNCWLRRPAGSGDEHNIGIEFVSVYDCHIINNDIMIGGNDDNSWGMTQTEVGFTFPNAITIMGNRFQECENQIHLDLINSHVLYNIFQSQGYTQATTEHLNLGLGYANTVFGNSFGGNYTTDGGSYVAGSGDNWAGNFSTDTGEAEVADNGITVAVPAAGAAD